MQGDLQDRLLQGNGVLFCHLPEVLPESGELQRVLAGLPRLETSEYSSCDETGNFAYFKSQEPCKHSVGLPRVPHTIAGPLVKWKNSSQHFERTTILR